VSGINNIKAAISRIITYKTTSKIQSLAKHGSVAQKNI